MTSFFIGTIKSSGAGTFYLLAIMDLSEKGIFKFILANNLRSTEELLLNTQKK